MYKFGKSSRERLATCDVKIQEIMNELIKIMDVSILCGYRDKAGQDEAFKAGFSQLEYPQSKHNSMPSKAVDVAPYDPVLKDVNWEDTESFERMCGIIEGIAHEKGIKIRLGRDFSFADRPHLQIEE